MNEGFSYCHGCFQKHSSQIYTVFEDNSRWLSYEALRFSNKNGINQIIRDK